MKITFEFANIKDMLEQMPKFAQLITSDDPAEKRIETALADDPTALIMKITPKDGLPFTEEEKEAIKATIMQFTDMARIDKIEKLRKELTPENAENAPSEAPKEKPKKNPPKEEKAEEPAETKADEEPAATETSARATLNRLVKSRGNASVKLIFHELGIKTFGDLKDLKEGAYAEAIALADKVSKMEEDEYAAALKEAGIKK